MQNMVLSSITLKYQMRMLYFLTNTLVHVSRNCYLLIYLPSAATAHCKMLFNAVSSVYVGSCLQKSSFVDH